jgi:drug/metabolite transporter (DMT)-like permease
MKNKKNLIIILLLGIFWSSFAALTKIISEISPFFITFSRMFIGVLSILLVLPFLKLKLNWKIIKQKYFALSFVGLLNCLIPYCLFALAAKKLDSSVLAILDGTIPLFEILITALFLKIKLKSNAIVGLVLGLLGTVFIAFHSLSMNHINLEIMVTIFMVLTATFSYAIGAIFINYFCQEIKPIEITIGSMLLTLPFLMPSCFFFDWSSATVLQINSLLALGVICTGFANLLYFKLITEEGSRIGSSTVLLIPVFGTIIGYFALNESIDYFKILGGILILFSMQFILDIPVFSVIRRRFTKLIQSCKII